MESISIISRMRCSTDTWQKARLPCSSFAKRHSAKIGRLIVRMDNGLNRFLGIVAYGEDKALKEAASLARAAADKISLFVKNNWKPLLAYLVAWSVIIASSGLLYGFKAVALPLTIGLGAGLGFGLIVGILTAKAFGSKETLWNRLNSVIERLDPNGTRQIVLAVGVSVLLAASVVFPYVLGGLFGMFIGNQLAVKVATEQNLGRSPKDKKNEKEALQKEALDMKWKIEELVKRLESLNGKSEHADSKN
jgi:hypothetical protein